MGYFDDKLRTIVNKIQRLSYNDNLNWLIQEADESTNIKTLPYMFDRLTSIVDYLLNKLEISAQGREITEHGSICSDARNLSKGRTYNNDTKVKTQYNYEIEQSNSK